MAWPHGELKSRELPAPLTPPMKSPLPPVPIPERLSADPRGQGGLHAGEEELEGREQHHRGQSRVRSLFLTSIPHLHFHSFLPLPREPGKHEANQDCAADPDCRATSDSVLELSSEGEVVLEMGGLSRELPSRAVELRD